MSLEDAALFSQVIAAIAVIISLAFVGIQLRQNTKSVHAATSAAHTDLLIQLGSQIILSDEVAQIWRLGLQGLDKLNGNERVRFTVYITTWMRFCEATRVQWLQGQLAREHWHSVEHQALGLASQPGVKEWWKVRAHWHSTEFRTWFEHLDGIAGDFSFYAPDSKAPQHPES